MVGTYETARRLNERLNDGDESKFPVMLIVVNELLYAVKPFHYFDV